jgi:hypothetical protein
MKWIVALLLAISIYLPSQAQLCKLPSENAEGMLKIVNNDVTYFIWPKQIVKYMKQLQKTNNTNYKLLIKKMDGVCFSQINLQKNIPDAEITAIQTLLKNQILPMALLQGKASAQYQPQGNFINQLNHTANGTTHGSFINDAGAVIFQY